VAVNILNLELGCCEDLGTASAVVGIFADVEVCRAICERCYASFKGNCAKIMQTASIGA
jgi:hypothetical protein